MTIWHEDKIVHVDRVGDKERASDGHSRYGAYIADRLNLFRDEFNDGGPLDPVMFAREAWMVASPPIMSPGLVDWRDDLHRVDLSRTEEGNNLMVVIKLPLLHGHLRAGLPFSYGDWDLRTNWGGGSYNYLVEPVVGPGGPAVTTLATIRHIPTWSLLVPTATQGVELVEEAIAAVEVCATTINAELPEIIRTVRGEK